MTVLVCFTFVVSEDDRLLAKAVFTGRRMDAFMFRIISGGGRLIWVGKQLQPQGMQMDGSLQTITAEVEFKNLS